MTKIERLKLRFASGMSEGRISSDEWELEFLPMLENALRWKVVSKFFRDGRIPGPAHGRPIRVVETCPMSGDETLLRDITKEVDAAIDAARTPTKE